MDKGEGEQGAGNAAADNRRFTGGAGSTGKPRGLRGRIQRVFHHPNQHVALAAKTFGFLHGKARFLQPTAHEACRGKGRKRRPRTRQSRHRVEKMLAPHVRIFGGGEAVQEPRIHLLPHRIVELIGEVVDIPEP